MHKVSVMACVQQLRIQKSHGKATEIASLKKQTSPVDANVTQMGESF